MKPVAPAAARWNRVARTYSPLWVCLAVLAAVALSGCPRATGRTAPTPRGELVVVVEPAAGGGEVYVNDELAGIVSAAGTVTIRLKATRYRVRIERDNAYDVFRVVEVPAAPAPAAELRVRMRERLE